MGSGQCGGVILIMGVSVRRVKAASYTGDVTWEWLDEQLDKNSADWSKFSQIFEIKFFIAMFGFNMKNEYKQGCIWLNSLLR